MQPRRRLAQIPEAYVFSSAALRDFRTDVVVTRYPSNEQILEGQYLFYQPQAVGIVFDPEGKFTVEEKNIFHRHKVTPYMGEELYGIVEHTYLRGNKVFEKGKIVSDPAGEIILRERNS